MNRPRNRQQRPPRQRPTSTSQQSAGTVPNVRQVMPGASVAIVLKEDQPTGRETTGVVQQLLTRGNHPRGIKVRLQDGQVGRVQRVTDTNTPLGQSSQIRNTSPQPRFTQRYTDVRAYDEYTSGPPPRSLADFIPDLQDENRGATENSGHAMSSTATVKCPFCDAFEGDEAAVSHHIESHLDGS